MDKIKEAGPETRGARERRMQPWRLAVLLLPFAGLLFPGLYARMDPTLLGFPFFYWYQFAWVILSVLCTGVAYLGTRPR